MPSAAEHAQILARLLPQGPVWPTSEQTDGTDAFSLLLDALSGEPARADASLESILEELIPDNANTDLDAWEQIVGISEESVTDTERLDRIRAILNGNGAVDRPTLELVAQRMAGDENVRLFHRAGPPLAVGVSNCGDCVRNGSWNSTWLCELMPNALSVEPDEFEAWTGFGALVDALVTSPVTLDVTSDELTIPSAGYASTPLIGTANGDIAYASVWIYVDGSGTESIKFGFLKRDNTAADTTFALPRGRWHKITVEASLGTGATAPLLRLKADSGNPLSYLSWAVAGVRTTALESRIAAFFPLHTRGHFGVQGEYATLLSHEDQLEVCW